jgi:hypothetical protein
VNSATVFVQNWGIEMKEDARHRMVFGDFVDKVFWLVISGFLFWIGFSVSELNKNMAVAINSISIQTEKLQAHDKIITELIRDVSLLKAKDAK